jgi:hypothetical protein
MTIGRRPATKSEAAKAIRLCDVISQVHKALAYPTCELVTIENPAEKFCDLFLGGSGATKKAPAFCSYRRKKNLQEWLVLKVLRLQLEAAEMWPEEKRTATAADRACRWSANRTAWELVIRWRRSGNDSKLKPSIDSADAHVWATVTARPARTSSSSSYTLTRFSSGSRSRNREAWHRPVASRQAVETCFPRARRRAPAARQSAYCAGPDLIAHEQIATLKILLLARRLRFVALQHSSRAIRATSRRSITAPAGFGPRFGGFREAGVRGGPRLPLQSIHFGSLRFRGGVWISDPVVRARSLRANFANT